MATATRTRANEQINLRMSRKQRSLIDRAADSIGKSRTEFVLEASCKRAEDVLVERTVFVLNDSDYDSFANALENPPAPNDALKELMSKPAPWE